MLLLISALLLGFGVPYYSQELSLVSAAVGFVPLFITLQRAQWKQRFIQALLAVTSAHAIATIWFLSHPFNYIYPAWILLALLVALPQALVFSLRISPIWTAFWIAFFEYARLHMLCGYSFNPIALPLLANGFLSQGMALVGSVGASFFLVWFQLLLSRTIFAASLPLLLYIALCWSATTLPNVNLPPFTVAILNTEYPPELECSFPQLQQLGEEKWRDLFALLDEVKATAPSNTLDLLLMPEGFTPFSASAAYLTKQQFSSLELATIAAKKMNSSVVIGLEGCEGGKSYNSAFFIKPDGSYSRYDKQVLVPLGEYIPFPCIAPLLEPYGVFSLYSQGIGPVNFEIKGLNFSPTICYEETFPTVTRLHKLAKADVLLNLTNDAWYPRSQLGESHFEHARIRTIELGAYLLRSCNMGKSGVINLFGKEVQPSQVLTHGKSSLLLYSLTPTMRTTPFEWAGCEGILLALFILCLLFQRTPGCQKL